jgi:hypothetical protein
VGGHSVRRCTCRPSMSSCVLCGAGTYLTTQGSDEEPSPSGTKIACSAYAIASSLAGTGSCHADPPRPRASRGTCRSPPRPPPCQLSSRSVRGRSPSTWNAPAPATQHRLARVVAFVHGFIEHDAVKGGPTDNEVLGVLLPYLHFGLVADVHRKPPTLTRRGLL